MPLQKTAQKGFAHMLVLLLLLVGLGIGLYVVKNPTVLKPKASENDLATVTTATIPPSLAFVFTGESNSGGLGQNSAATAEELAPTSAVKILNNNTLNFEDLDIGTNNLIDHAGLTANYGPVAHGFELELANLVKANTFPNNPQVYLIKTGQGESFLSDWQEGGVYWNKFLQRLSSAKTQVPASVQWVVWYSMGVNDYLKPTPVEAYKAETLAHINKIKAQLPGAIIVITQFQAMGERFSQYNNALQEIALSDSHVSVVDTTGATVTKDGYHWDYQGLKTVTAKMAEVTKNAIDSLSTHEPNFTPNTASYCVGPGASRVHLEWTQIPGATLYKVFRSTIEPGSGIKLAELSHYAYNDESAIPGVQYSYAIEAEVETYTFGKTTNSIVDGDNSVAEPMIPSGEKSSANRIQVGTTSIPGQSINITPDFCGARAPEPTAQAQPVY